MATRQRTRRGREASWSGGWRTMPGPTRAADADARPHYLVRLPVVSWAVTHLADSPEREGRERAADESRVGVVGSTSDVGVRACVVPDEGPHRTVKSPGDWSTDMSSATLTPLTPSQTVPTDGRRHRLRLRLKPKAPTTGFVDGAWWPRTRDLSAELAELLGVLAVRLGQVERVSYHLGDWKTSPRKSVIGGSVVRLAGYRAQHPDTVDVLAARHRLTLLVVPPETASPVAHRILRAAALRGNAEPIAVLRAGPPLPRPVVPRLRDVAQTAAEERWDGEGGRGFGDSSGRAAPQRAGVDARPPSP